MHRIAFISLFLLFNQAITAQKRMRPIEELIDTTDPGWRIVKEMIDSATNKVEILSADSARARAALYDLQVTSRSSLGAVVLYTGGILIDHGWIRILGSGNTKLDRGVMQWHRKLYPAQNPGYIIVADDAIGGFYLQNGGGLGDDIGNMYYFSPDNLEFEPMEYGYTDFLNFCFNGDLEGYYKGYRWKTWKTDVTSLSGNKTFSFFPMLWTKEGKDIEKNTRAPIPVEEQYFFNLDLRKQLGLDKPDMIGHE
ncbi:MAG: DUF2625 domain-containing protein [Chitinophagaceae bacterium]|nr:DUF2625 domain-containing protein [Chitinophagaceae bacterium]